MLKLLDNLKGAPKSSPNFMVLDLEPQKPKAVFGESVNIRRDQDTEARLRSLDALIKQAQDVREKWASGNCSSPNVPADMRAIMEGTFNLEKVANSSPAYRGQVEKSREDH